MNYKSERLTFREFKEDDFDLLYSLFSNEEVMKLTLRDRVSCEEDLRPYFNSILKNNTTILNREAYEYGVFLTSDDSFVGIADIEINKQNAYGGYGEIGYLLLNPFWNKGYATEMANKLIEIGFKDVNLHRIYAKCNTNNDHSKKVMEKIGMVKEGELRKVRLKNGRWDNEYLYSILFEEWIEINKISR